MAGEPALVKLQDRLIGRLQSIPGVNILQDRTDDEPVLESERPAIVVRILEGQPDEQLGGGEEIHLIEIELDLYERRQSFNSITRDLALMWSQVNAALAADRTLGGLVPIITIDRYTASPDSVPDLGCMTLQLSTRLTTPADDWNTVSGTTALIP